MPLSNRVLEELWISAQTVVSNDGWMEIVVLISQKGNFDGTACL